MEFRPKVRNNEILVQELEKELLIYDLKINKALSLNETCAMVWRECDGDKTIPEIVSILNRKTNGLVNEEVVWLALETLQKENLLTTHNAISEKLNGLSRREVIRKIGFASMVAIPVITSLIAPTAANAASGGICPTGSIGGVPGTQYVGLSPGFSCNACSGIGGVCATNARLGECCSGIGTFKSCVPNGGQGVACFCQCS